MGHPDSGTIMALIEGEVEEREAVDLLAHLEECPACKDLERDLRETSVSVAQALASVDVEPDLARPRAKLFGQSKVGEPTSERRQPALDGRPSGSWTRGTRWSLAKAASVAVFLTAGAAAALPGSPIRNWIADWQASEPTGTQPEGSAALLSEEGLGPDEGPGPAAGIRAYEGRIAVWIHDLPDDAELRVRWIDGEEAWVHAGEGTRFNTSQGRLEAFNPPGPVTVDLPRSLERIDLRLNGSALVRKRGNELEILEPNHQRTPSEIIFGSEVGTNEGVG